MRLAATVMLVRPNVQASGIEVLMVRRSTQSAFAPDAFVFPGGTVDSIDYERRSPWTPGRLRSEFRAVIPPELCSSEAAVGERDAAALVAAAVRELEEEAAIRMDPGDLHLFSHWITPPTEPRRYNTHFFIARAGTHHVGIADRVETHDERWVVPADALAQYEAQTLHLVYPTIKHLERLARFDNVESLLIFALEKPILTIMPNCAPHEGFVMPGALERAW
ncbi:MAG TPA: NUDIX domain-containing protein [Candidatus Baltobacteraceae bacterium]|jgi:8-oxo-dGTP pyrophosphatase MutT (NUDIX family)|nr:NUDIX domain-containing protein [Candidatus Baltobacteraceae bacterium]